MSHPWSVLSRGRVGATSVAVKSTLWPGHRSWEAWPARASLWRYQDGPRRNTSGRSDPQPFPKSPLFSGGPFHDTNAEKEGGLVLSIKILVMVSLAVCWLSVDAKAFTTKQATCYKITGFCVVNCDPGTVVVSGGCMNSSNSVGISASFPSGDRQWACRPTSRAAMVNAYAICQ